MMEQYEKDKEIERLNKDVSRLEELLSVSETQYASVEQMVERLREQLKEANRLILWCARISWTGNQEEDDFDRYLAKWGVK